MRTRNLLERERERDVRSSRIKTVLREEEKQNEAWVTVTDNRVLTAAYRMFITCYTDYRSPIGMISSLMKNSMVSSSQSSTLLSSSSVSTPIRRTNARPNEYRSNYSERLFFFLTSKYLTDYSI